MKGWQLLRARADADIHYSHDGGELIFPYVYQDKPTVISLVHAVRVDYPLIFPVCRQVDTVL